MRVLLVLPLVVPLGTAVVTLLFWRHRRSQRAISLIGSLALLASAVALLVRVWTDGILATQPGSWPAPYGISLVADLFGAMMVVLAGTTGAAVMVYSIGSLDEGRERHGYHPLYHVLLLGVCGAFLTGDLFNLYVWFEVLLIASFVLLSLGSERAQLEGGIKYVTLNLMSSALFLAALGTLYGVLGTLNMADVAVALRTTEHHGMVLVLALLFLVAFGIKAAMFPLFSWLPASYHTPPAAISALFAGLLTKVGVYALIRVFTLLFTEDSSVTHTLILVLACLTMITGVLGAAAENEFRRILSFHIVSQIGYMLMGLGLFTPLALAGSVFYIAHHIIVKTNLFLVSGIVFALRGTYLLPSLGGLYGTHPTLGALFLVPALSLAGIPPLSGFWAKLLLLRAGLDAGQHAVVAVALIVSFWTLFSMTKIWAEVFWKEADDPIECRLAAGTWRALAGPVAVLALTTVTIGLLAGPLVRLSMRTAGELLDRDSYIRAVMREAN